MISGFLITGILLKNADQPRHILIFYERRIRRIFPALIIVLLTTFGMGWFILIPSELTALGRHILSGASFSSNFALFFEAGYFDVASDRKPLLHLWSLGIEEQFYIVWPPLLLMLQLSRRPLTLVCIIAAASFILCVWTTFNTPDLAFYFPTTRAWELLAGAILAIARRTNPSIIPSNKGRTFIGVAGLVLVAVAIFALPAGTAFPGWWAAIPVLGSALVLLAEQSPINKMVLSQRPIVFIGLISYPLYLWHWPLLTFQRIASQTAPTAVQKLSMLALSVVLAIITYLVIERPLRFGRVPFRIPVLVTAIVLMGSLGYATKYYNGWEFRVPVQIRELQSAQLDTSQWRKHECLLEMNDSTFSDACMPAGHPAVLLWGDSYAGALYPSVRKLGEAEGFYVAQFTTAGCPPLLDFIVQARPHCKVNNSVVLNKIKLAKPQIVVLHSTWNYDDLPKIRARLLAQTISSIRSVGVSRVIVVGPPPNWPDGLPRAIYADYIQRGLISRLQNRSRLMLNVGVADLDKVFRQEVEVAGAEYFSAWNAFCNDEGCLRLIDGALVTPDFGHLSFQGARFLVDKFAPLLKQRF